ncbi:MAG: IPT/TIG domain-containing protein, partial [Chloroflexota bacterium]|nr:IPT/TIG domain-containing protein [Chloroflexota bacterium]
AVGSGTPASCTDFALRAAVASGGLVTFNCGPNPHTILVGDDIQIGADTVIDGGGSQQGGQITLSGGDTTRVFITDSRVHFTIRNLTIVHGKEPGPAGMGGGIYGGYRSTITISNSRFEENDGTAGGPRGGGAIAMKSESMLEVRDSAFVHNRGINGAAINNLLSGLTVVNSTFIENDATLGGSTPDGFGGAIFIDGASAKGDQIAGTVSIRDSTFVGNRGAGQGGAISSFLYAPDRILIENTTFNQNQILKNVSDEALGGAIKHGGDGQLTIRNATFAENRALGQGGALWADGRHSATFTNVTFTQNRAVGDQSSGNGGLGGAIAGGGNWLCDSCTIANNHAGYIGGGIFAGSSATLKNTIVSNNTAFNSGNNWYIDQNCSTPLIDGGANLQFPAPTGVNTGDPTCAASAVIADPKLGVLADNGGATQTIALAADSPALDRAKDCPSTDQRGISRPQGSACDIGAYELVKALGMNPSSVFAGGRGFTLTVRGADFATDSKIVWDSIELPTRYRDSTRLQAEIPMDKIANSGSVTIAVSKSSFPARNLAILVLNSTVNLPLVVS